MYDCFFNIEEKIDVEKLKNIYKYKVLKSLRHERSLRILFTSTDEDINKNKVMFKHFTILLYNLLGSKCFTSSVVDVDELNNSEKLVYSVVQKAFKVNKGLKDIVFQSIENICSRRLLHYFLTHYSRYRRITYNLNKSLEPVDVTFHSDLKSYNCNKSKIDLYNHYRNYLSRQSNKCLFSPYARSVIISNFHTSLSELHYFTWLHTNGVYKIFLMLRDDVQKFRRKKRTQFQS